MVYDKHHLEKAPDREGHERVAIVFELRPLSAIVETTGELAQPEPVKSLEQLRALAEAAVAPSNKTSSVRNVYQRSRDVRTYVLARASGNCEGCKNSAPFIRKDGTPYLEPHHIRRLSDGGPDNPSFVIALCPNCHRRVHAGKDGSDYNSTLLAAMEVIEPN